MDPDSVPLGVECNGLGGLTMMRRHITPLNSIRRTAAAAPTDACVPERAVGSGP